MKEHNNLKLYRQSYNMTTTKFAQILNISPRTLYRIEHYTPCRVETKRKILAGLGIPARKVSEIWPDTIWGESRIKKWGVRWDRSKL